MSAEHGSYYLPEPTRWPAITSSGLFLLALGFIMLMNEHSVGPWFMIAGFLVLLYVIVSWFGEVAGESERGLYDSQVDMSFRMGMGWFIVSEVMFFAAFFGALFYARMLAVPWLSETDSLWPGFENVWPTAGPLGENYIGADAHEVASGQFASIGAWGLPFWNTVILLTSSVTVTIAHWALKEGHRLKLIIWLGITVLLGSTFLYLQATEYAHAYTELGLTLGTGVYGSTFFMLTGFHGLHVTIGTITLAVILFRCIKGHFTKDNHFAFEAAAWYWHFVDTVWVGLFIFVYVL
ncbi:MAG: cytochrome c oxidase subunit III [marine bacterium B5-7]|nr:MAG: cytochrome c oxidase subunit III [marine bacterium B5-7]